MILIPILQGMYTPPEILFLISTGWERMILFPIAQEMYNPL